MPTNHIKIQTEIDHLIKEFPKLFLVLGDFYCQNEIWGIKETKKYQIIGSFINKTFVSTTVRLIHTCIRQEDHI